MSPLVLACLAGTWYFREYGPHNRCCTRKVEETNLPMLFLNLRNHNEYQGVVCTEDFYGICFFVFLMFVLVLLWDGVVSRTPCLVAKRFTPPKYLVLPMSTKYHGFLCVVYKIQGVNERQVSPTSSSIFCSKE